MEQWPKVSGAGFQVQNHWVASRLNQPFIFPRSIKWLGGPPWDLVVKSKLSPCSGCVALRQSNLIHKKGIINFEKFILMAFQKTLKSILGPFTFLIFFLVFLQEAQGFCFSIKAILRNGQCYSYHIFANFVLPPPWNHYLFFILIYFIIFINYS